MSNRSNTLAAPAVLHNSGRNFCCKRLSNSESLSKRKNNMADKLTAEQAEQLSRIGAAAAGSAIAKGLDEDEKEKPDMKKINELATLAASAAIQKHLGEETDGNKEKAADIARAVASSAISRGLAQESRDERAFMRVESIAKEAAVAAMNMGVGET
ncbi:hypothetical protein BSKO_04517 [Bryopsis sp. KO-2023]|nr:hypothetical protein BSKO_04517 [Bryopsis sp. KO-2023]